MILDATAGNRMMWNHCGYNPPNTIFLDRETKLARPPDIIADFRHCPFRDDVFDCIIFDPPYYYHKKTNFWLWKGPEHPRHWYGYYETKRELLTNIHQGQKEFQRLTKRLCMQWNDHQISLWKILPFFKSWITKQIKEHESKWKRGKDKTYWITFVRSSR